MTYVPTGQTATRRLVAQTYQKEFTIPIKISFVRIVNAGLSDIKICFQGDDPGSYVLLKSLQELPILNVVGDKTVIKYISILNQGELELLMWG
jgi:hypothetical protein